MDGPALAVAKHLDLDMAGGGQVFLDIDIRVSKGGLAFGPRGHVRAFHFRGIARHLHPASATARGGLDDDRIPDFLAQFFRLVQAGHAALAARNAWHTKGFHGVLGSDLVAHDADMFGCGADEGQVMILHYLYEIGVLAQKTVTGVNRLCARHFAGRDDRRNGQVTLSRGRRPDADRFIGHAHMHRICVSGGVHRNGLDSHFPRGTNDTQGDFASVRYQYLVEHARALLDDHQGRAELDGRTVLDEDTLDRSRTRRGDVVHGFHR